jgi:hypothetical protein
VALISKTNPWKILVILVGLVLLVAIFYAEENWRGKRAWEQCKQELEAKGENLEWDDYIPPPVPDDQNFFKAPKMAVWFVKPKPGSNRTNELSEHLNSSRFVHGSPNSNSLTLAELTVLPSSTNAGTVSKNADVVLRYSSFGSSVFLMDPPTGENSPSVSTNNPSFPVIKMGNVPLSLAIDNLAHNANLKYNLDVKIGSGPTGSDAELCSEPVVSTGWINIPARQALLATLNNFDLQLIDDPTTGVARITAKNPDASSTYIAPDVRKQLTELLKDAMGANAIGSQGPAFLIQPPNQVRPLQIVCHSEKLPRDTEIIKLFTELFPNGSARLGSPRIWVESAGTNGFRVRSDAAAAGDYLAWSDQFQSDFDLIREALKRPYAQMDGDYSDPVSMPIPNFVNVRIVAQTLAQRAQCYLLLGQPQKALSEVTLLHDLCRLLEGAPTGKPMTLVAAMINVAVVRLYTDTIADGTRLKAWSESQLIALQKQLEEIDLLPFVAEAFHEEQIGSCRIIEIYVLKNKKNPKFPYWPRGWIYQNLVTVAMLDQKVIDSFDPAKGLIVPHIVDRSHHEIETKLSHHSPYNLFAAILIPNFTKAMQTTMHNQTLANEAQIACALERYRLAHGEYPETLNALVPQFIEKLPHDIIGGQPLHYRRTDNGQFLLYSVGWNEMDDGGQVVSKPDGSEDWGKGDWVWQYPAK